MITDKNWEIIDGGVTAAPGFLACGVHAGLKKKNKDLAIVYAEQKCNAAGCYTTNLVQAAPLKYDEQLIKQGQQVQAVVVNSGNANACTGKAGMEDVLTTAAAAAAELGIQPQSVLVASTGVIGVRLPVAKIVDGIKEAVPLLQQDGGPEAASAIMTTDLRDKQKALRFKLGEKTVTIGGMAKGSGMIHPNMATMLCFITTDAAITAGCLQKALSQAVHNSFNMITVDGDTSTNDMVAVLANGLAGNEEIIEDSAAYEQFQAALQYVCCYLAQEIARDGEGATKLLEVQVKNAASEADARLAAKSIVGSNLVKTAIFGEDANWGRILAAAGYSGAKFDPDNCAVFLGDEAVAAQGCGLPFSEERAKEILQQDKIVVTVDFQEGTAEAVAWGCDLSYEYVRINGSYRS